MISWDMKKNEKWYSFKQEIIWGLELPRELKEGKNCFSLSFSLAFTFLRKVSSSQLEIHRGWLPLSRCPKLAMEFLSASRRRRKDPAVPLSHSSKKIFVIIFYDRWCTYELWMAEEGLFLLNILAAVIGKFFI